MGQSLLATAALGLALLLPGALLQDCEEPIDADGDGYPADVDCNDEDPTIFPDQDEPCECDGIDQNCNGVIDDFPCDFPVCGEGGQVGDYCGDEYGECAEGLVCCYPCGIPDCGPNICHEPCYEDYCAGGCPLYP